MTRYRLKARPQPRPARPAPPPSPRPAPPPIDNPYGRYYTQPRTLADLRKK